MQNSAVTQQSTRKLFPFMPGFTPPFQNFFKPPNPLTHHPRRQWGVLRMDPLNYSKKHRRNKPQVTSQPEASSSCLQNYSSLTAPLWLHSFLPRPADPSPAQGCPTLLSRGPGSLPSPGVTLHLGQPCPKGTLLVFGHFVPQELPLPSACPAAGHGSPQGQEAAELHWHLGIFL